ncbi:hypothetical protein T492DRAFT_1068172 [Pavlovales sp. CCMP2436]|nr:hypothetical protein T492DRAFT_1068172 [Pavlovales sp. CCMP2436]
MPPPPPPAHSSALHAGARPAELSLAPPPAFATLGARRAESERRVHAAQARIAAAHVGAAGGPSSALALLPADEVDVAVERLLLSGVSAAALCGGLGTTRTRDGAALIAAAAYANLAAERAPIAPERYSSSVELTEADDDEEVAKAVRSPAEVDALRAVYEILSTAK